MLWASNETSRAEAAQLRDDEHLSSFVARILDLNRCGWICNSPRLSNYQKLIINLAASSGCTGLCSAPRQRAKSGITLARDTDAALGQLSLLFFQLSTIIGYPQCICVEQSHLDLYLAFCRRCCSGATVGSQPVEPTCCTAMLPLVYLFATYLSPFQGI